MLAGDGVERGRLEQQAERLGLTHRVRFLGTVNRERSGRLFRGASVFAFPSRGEAFGVALLEAMAAGVPAVAAAAGGIPEFAKHGENALLVDVDQAGQLADALARSWWDEHVRERVIAGGERTARDLDWVNVSQTYEDLYTAAIARRGR